MEVGGEGGGRRGDRSVFSEFAQRPLFDVGVRNDGEEVRGGGEGRPKKRFFTQTSDIFAAVFRPFWVWGWKV